MDWNLYNDAMRLDESGESEKALESLKTLIGRKEHAEDNATVFVAIAWILRKEGRPNEALQPAKQAVDMLPRSSRLYPRAVFLKAAVDIDLGDWKSGAKMLAFLKYAFETYLQESENRELLQEVERYQGIALTELAHFALALPFLEAAAQRGHKKDVSLYHLGRCFFALGKMREAKDTFQEMLKLGTEERYETEAHNFLGSIYYTQKQYAWAMQEFEWCLDHVGIRTKRINILTVLVNAARALGLVADAQRYSDMLRHA